MTTRKHFIEIEAASKQEAIDKASDKFTRINAVKGVRNLGDGSKQSVKADDRPTHNTCKYRIFGETVEEGRGPGFGDRKGIPHSHPFVHNSR